LNSIAADINEKLMIKQEFSNIENALRQDTFEKFKYQAIFGSCKKMVEVDRNFPMPKFDQYPRPNQRNTTVPATIKKIKEILSTGFPVSLQGLCPFFDQTKAKQTKVGCEGRHALVISGYRRVCRIGCNKNESTCCIDSLKVQNSWGEDWQKKNDDGWVAASRLFNHALMEPGTLSWLSPPKP